MKKLTINDKTFNLKEIKLMFIFIELLRIYRLSK